MYEDTEDAFDIDEDFFNALALLHSTEDDSTEKLRKMLDTSLERRFGFDKTLMARMPKKFLQNTETETSACKKSRVYEETGSLSPFAGDTTETSWRTMQIFNAAVEDYNEKGDIPRISIPDEGSGDGLFCKICNGAKLGPLILLECQECQEVYHPLCHQPPVVDIDVYDPRIVWRCRKCMDISSVNSTITLDEKKVKRSRSANVASRTNKVSAKANKLGKLDGNSSKNETTIADQASLDVPQRSNYNVELASITKTSSHSYEKMTRVSSTNQLRKRIGSKLSVTRSVVK
ncbi:integrator complex subunit 12 [Xylocopa sonorina]|uniref:integrator complex subunit 12 n=1 Tax=Xylocopa sonorina TaxID=1818115 RepID=UPI00403B1266